MARYAAFLRGINVGARKATGEQLRTAFEDLGFDGVSTFRASGNVVFEAPGKVDAATVGRGLAKSLGYDVAVFLRTAREIDAIVAHEPFDEKQLKASKGKLHVALLPRKPPAAAQKRMLALQGDGDRFAIHGRELYWLPQAGLSDSAVGMKGVSDALGSNTVRTKGTIEQLAARFFGG